MFRLSFAPSNLTSSSLSLHFTMNPHEKIRCHVSYARVSRQPSAVFALDGGTARVRLRGEAILPFELGWSATVCLHPSYTCTARRFLFFSGGVFSPAVNTMQVLYDSSRKMRQPVCCNVHQRFWRLSRKARVLAWPTTGCMHRTGCWEQPSAWSRLEETRPVRHRS